MTDLRDLFHEIAGPVPAAHASAAEQADADLARGRRALRRRRTVQTIAGSAFGVAALAAAIAFTGAPSAPADNATVSAPTVQLVAYKGEQPAGFTVDKVPDGWFIQSSKIGYLVLAPDKAKNVDPAAGPLADPDVFEEKITIMLESKDQNGPSRAGKAVQVGDQDGVLVTSLGTENGRELWVKEPAGISMIVQVWDGIGLTESQIVELGAGVHVQKDALRGVG